MPEHSYKNRNRVFWGMAGATFCFVVGGWLFVQQVARAADGSGTNTVLPTSLNAGSVGNTLTFTYTAAEAMNSGEVAITVPAGWSTPQGVAGSAGYTTATSASGVIGNVLDNGDSASGWVAGTACTNALSVDTGVKQEGTGSISCANGDELSGDRWYKNISAQNWSAYTRVGFWIRTTGPITSANRLRFAYDNDNDLATPIDTIDIGQTVLANTWTHIVLTIPNSTRTSVTSYGFVINHGSEFDNNTVRIDDILIGPGVPTFSGSAIRLRFVQLVSPQTVIVAYGSGGGASGATSPASGGISLFTTSARISSAGTLTPIASSPQVTVNNPAPTTTSIFPASKSAGDGTFVLTVNGTNFVPTSSVRINGSSRTTIFVSASQLTATILASDISSAGTATITVVNSTPGGGTSNGQTLTILADVSAPAAVANLALSNPTTSSLLLTWAAPGDDGNIGTATLYDIRYSETPILTDGDFVSAELVSGEPDPVTAGNVQSMTVGGLSSSTLYYFALKTQDEVLNVSAISNVPSRSTSTAADTTDPAVVTNLALSNPTTSSILLTWTAPGDDGNTGTATLYDIRYSTAPIVAGADFTAAALVTGEPLPLVAGSVQTMTVSDLSASTLYYFAMKSQDEVPNLSSVSNMPSLSTSTAADTVAPSAVIDLVLSNPTESSVFLTWTAPGDDNNSGTAALYDIRYATSQMITEADFTAAIQVVGEPIPLIVGTVQSMTVSGLSANTHYFFRMKTRDEAPNISLVSNQGSLSTQAIPSSGGGSTTGRITVVKTVINDSGQNKTAGDFDLFVNGNTVLSGVTNTFVSTGSAFIITESPDPLYTRSFSGDCDSDGRMNFNPGDYRVCTITNDDIGAPVVVPPLPSIINVVVVPDPLVLSEGSGSVTYTYTLRNLGQGPISLVNVTDDVCTSITLVSGDVNSSLTIESDEVWIYQCSMTLTETTTNTVVASGLVNGIGVTDLATSTVVVGESVVPPLINVRLIPSPLGLTADGGVVTYTYVVTNPGIVPVSDIVLLDDSCSDIAFESGDTNNNSQLEDTEIWTYRCQSMRTKTTTSTAFVIGQYNGIIVRDYAIVTVLIGSGVTSLDYSVSDALASATTIQIDKSLRAPVPGKAILCVSGSLMKLASDGNIVTQTDSTIYYCGEDGNRYVFLDAKTFLSWYADFSGVSIVSAETLAAIPLGGTVTYRPGSRMVKIESDPKVYAVAKGGVLRWVTDESVATALYGADWNTKISDISVAIFSSSYVVGAPITMADILVATCTTSETFSEFLTIESVSTEVRALQELLQCLGYFPATVAPTAYFGPVTSDAVKQFQTANGIEAVGYVGPATRDALNLYHR